MTDAILALYPIKLIVGLQLSRRMKVGLSCLLGFGLLAAVCAIVKTVMLANLTHSEDVTYFIARLAFVTLLEAWIVLLVGCVPPLRPLFAQAAKRMFSHPSKRGTTRIYVQQNGLYGKDSGSGNRKSQARGPILVGFQALPDGKTTPDSKVSVELRETRKFERRSLKSPDSGFRLGEVPCGVVLTTDIDVSDENGSIRKGGKDNLS